MSFFVLTSEADMMMPPPGTAVWPLTARLATAAPRPSFWPATAPSASLGVVTAPSASFGVVTEPSAILAVTIALSARFAVMMVLLAMELEFTPPGETEVATRSLLAAPANSAYGDGVIGWRGVRKV